MYCPARGIDIPAAAFGATVENAISREQVDQAFGDFQGAGWEVGEPTVRDHTARLLTLRPASRADRGLHTQRECSMATRNAIQAALDNLNSALQLHDGMGYTPEHHVERCLREAKLLTIAGGPKEAHRETLADGVSERPVASARQGGCRATQDESDR